VDGVSSSDLNVVAKHLCGVGTDMALSSLLPLRNHINACFFATCCHGVCSWKGYVGREFLLDALCHEEDVQEILSSFTFEEADFDTLRRWSAFALNSEDESDAQGDQSGFPQHSDEVLDRITKLDHHSSKHENCCTGIVGKDSCNIDAVVEVLRLQCGARGLARACQRLIDYGRLQYMRNVLLSNRGSNSFHVEMLRYVPFDVTPQNTALIAYQI
jgi:tRNA:m4X modification enzyme